MADDTPDLHVVSLTYSLKTPDDVTYLNPPAVQLETPDASFALDAETLTVTMKTHYADIGAARSAIEPVLRAWEAQAEMSSGRQALLFEYQDAQVVDRTPAVEGTTRRYLSVTGAAFVVTGGELGLHVTRKSYPSPPTDFRLTPDAASVVERWRGYKAGREPLQAMAYFCLTVAEAAAGSRANAAWTLAIGRTVLDKMGELTSERGDLATARKAKALRRPLTGQEIAWLEDAVKKLALRLGEAQRGVLRPLTLADLPQL